MNEFVDVIDMVMSEEALGLVAGLVVGGVSAPVAIGGAVVAGLAALFLPKEQTRKVISTVSRAVSFKRKSNR
ncbi:MAG: hypothetical protein ACRCUF_16570 [Aeromonas sobria]